MYQSRKSLENILILLFDLMSLSVSLGIAFLIRYGILFGRSTAWEQGWMLCLAIVIYVLVSIISNANRHFFRRGYFEELVNVIRLLISFGVTFVTMLFIMHRAPELSRLIFGYFGIFATVLIYCVRIIFKKFMTNVYKHSKYSNRMLIVANSESAKDILTNFIGYNEWYRKIVGFVALDETKDEFIEGIEIVANKDTFLDYVIHNDIDEVFLATPMMIPTSLLHDWVVELEQMGVIVNVNIDAFDITNYGKKTLNRVGKYAVVSFARNIFTERELFAKRILDIIGSLVGMVLLGIATIFVAPAIKLESPGPVFFGQTRVGKNGRKFTFYKFRSMYQDAEERKKELMKHNEVKGLMFKMTDDPRITKVGKILRKTSIDELPQFWNILRGDMSLVGTRPPTIDEFERYEAKHKCRLSMTPGLTGMWQVSGRSDINDFDEVVKLDMQYIDDWTILKDIKILLQTVKVVLLGRGSR